MNRSALAFGLTITASALALVAERDAAACGGCFHPPTPPTQVASDITDERMLLSVSPTQTTLYDQIRYAGSPAAFAWVLPIHGTVTVGLSADVLFDSVDTLTATRINAPAASCPGPPNNCTSGGGCGGSTSNSAFGLADGTSNRGVTVTKQENVGPYEAVQLHATDAGAINAWLAKNQFVIPPDVIPIIDAYVAEGFDFLAMKLLPNQGIQAMRPVRVSMPGAALSLPLRMAAIGTGATVGITIWVVSDGRYEPQNFPFFHIEDSQLVWDFQTSSSNYTTLRASNEAALGGRGWEIESSIDLNEKVISNLILSGGSTSGNGATNTPSAPASDDYLAVTTPAIDGDAGAEAGSAKTAEQVRNDDLAALFAGLDGPNVRVTRVRSDIAHSAMTTDLIFQAAADQTELSNVRTATQTTGCPIYDNCAIVGYGTVAQAQTSVGGTGGCVLSSTSKQNPGIPFAAIGTIGALALSRAFRRKRRPSKKA